MANKASAPSRNFKTVTKPGLGYWFFLPSHNHVIKTFWDAWLEALTVKVDAAGRAQEHAAARASEAPPQLKVERLGGKEERSSLSWSPAPSCVWRHRQEQGRSARAGELCGHLGEQTMDTPVLTFRQIIDTIFWII